MHTAAFQFAAIIVATIIAIWRLHRPAWLILRLLVGLGRRVPPSFWGLRDRARDHPFRARLTARYPRPHALVRARLSPRAFTGMPLTLMAVAAAYLLALLGGLIEDLMAKEGIVGFDVDINAFFGPYRVRPLVEAFLWVTTLGSGPAVTAVAVITTGLLWIGRRSSVILPLWVTLLGAEATTWAGKYLIARTRPEFIEAASATSPSFPNGHATASMAVYGFLAYMIAHDLRHVRARFKIAFWTAGLIVLIGFSWIFLSLQYTSVVASGFLVGGFWLLVGFAMTERAWGRAGTDIDVAPPQAATPGEHRIA